LPRERQIRIMAALETVLLACALVASLIVQPWRMLRGNGGAVPPLATPLLASLILLPWLWAWPMGATLPVHWSGAPLLVLVLGWPLAVPVLAFAGVSTILTTGASIHDALSATVWCGMVPATTVLLLGHAVRRTFGMHPVAYIIGRAYAVPLAALFACALASAWAGGRLDGAEGPIAAVAAFLMAMGEAAWTGAVVSLLVAWQPGWLATWSDERYLTSRKSPHRRA
jgi:uncharacterized membrane protein